LPPAYFRRAPWSSPKKRPNNDIFYIGINMVRMIILKRRMHHGIANAAVDDLPCHLKSPPTPQLITPLPSVDTRMGTPRRRWEKGSTPIKTHPPSPCTTRRSKRRRTRASKTPPPVIHYRHHFCSSIQWLYLRHRFVQAYLHQHHLSDTHTERCGASLGGTKTP
jgi:hypothetical protein